MLERLGPTPGAPESPLMYAQGRNCSLFGKYLNGGVGDGPYTQRLDGSQPKVSSNSHSQLLILYLQCALEFQRYGASCINAVMVCFDGIGGRRHDLLISLSRCWITPTNEHQYLFSEELEIN